ncbi:hypothetical protein Tco_1067816 [Tanacetum coccineum]|uniref:Uncharacterized protein n=1 Tax=Tanacetum coccineum TaxID=301880 RepID=A0ABQ5HF91_9ASTR
MAKQSEEDHKLIQSSKSLNKSKIYDQVITSSMKFIVKDLLQVVVLFVLAWMDCHELELTGDLLSIGVVGSNVGLVFVEGSVSFGIELSMGEEDLLTREVPSLKNSSYKGPKRRSNSCCDGTVVSAEGETFCSFGAGSGLS